MEELEIRTRLLELETIISHHEKMIDDLSDMIIEQGKSIDLLKKQNELLKSALTTDIVKPLSEETPPPHY